MDSGELELSSQEVFSSSTFGEIPECSHLNKRFNEILTDVHACIHAHTCNPPGPDNSHTHTCYHIHTKIVPPKCDDTTAASAAAANIGKKHPLGNKEAVRKYYEKKKARAASLEDEVARLRAINQQLLKRLQGEAVLEADISRLKCLLVDIRGRVEGEIGSFSYHKPMEGSDVYQHLVNPDLRGTYVMNPCDLQRHDQGSDELNGQGLNSCGIEILQCSGSQRLKEVPGCALGYGTPTSNASRGNKRKIRKEMCSNDKPVNCKLKEASLVLSTLHKV